MVSPRLPFGALDGPGGGSADQHQVEPGQGVREPGGTEDEKRYWHQEFGPFFDRAGRPQDGRHAETVVHHQLETDGDGKAQDPARDADQGEGGQAGEPPDGQMADHHLHRADQHGDIAHDGQPRPQRVAGDAADHGRGDDEGLAGHHPPDPGLAEEGEWLGRTRKYRGAQRGVGATRPCRPVPLGQRWYRSVAVPACFVGQSATRARAVIWLGRSRTTSSPGTPLRRPYASAWSAPM